MTLLAYGFWPSIVEARLVSYLPVILRLRVCHWAQFIKPTFVVEGFYGNGV